MHIRSATTADLDQLVRQVWGQVAILRASRIAHRDLRLANVFVGEDRVVWLIDFGISTFEGADEAAKAYDTILANAKKYKSDARIVGVQVQQMLKGGQEVIVGAVTDGKRDVMMFTTEGKAIRFARRLSRPTLTSLNFLTSVVCQVFLMVLQTSTLLKTAQSVSVPQT